MTIVLLAAGSSSRMRGGDKLLEPVDGVPLLRKQALVALATGCPVIVTLPVDRPLRDAALGQLEVTRVRVPDAVDGMALSLRAGLAAAGAGAVLVLLADLPEITTEDLRQIMTRHREMPQRILRAAAQDGTPGHPVLFPAWALQELAALSGDAGAREVVKRHAERVEAVLLPDRHAVTDLDTPEDWAAWRSVREHHT